MWSTLNQYQHMVLVLLGQICEPESEWGGDWNCTYLPPSGKTVSIERCKNDLSEWELRLSLATEKTSNEVDYGIGWGVDLDYEKEMEAAIKYSWGEIWSEPRLGGITCDASLFPWV